MKVRLGMKLCSRCGQRKPVKGAGSNPRLAFVCAGCRNARAA